MVESGFWLWWNVIKNECRSLRLIIIANNNIALRSANHQLSLAQPLFDSLAVAPYAVLRTLDYGSHGAIKRTMVTLPHSVCPLLRLADQVQIFVLLLMEMRVSIFWGCFMESLMQKAWDFISPYNYQRPIIRSLPPNRRKSMVTYEDMSCGRPLVV